VRRLDLYDRAGANHFPIHDAHECKGHIRCSSVVITR
jgi:hypothetical protein